MIDSFKPDLVHCWMRRAASLMPKLQIPAIGWFGGYYEPAHFRRCTHFVRRHAGHRRAHVQPRRAEGHGALRADLPTIEAGPPVDRADLANPRRCHVLLTLSRLHEKKGLDVLLAALVDHPDALPGLPATARWRPT